VFAGDTTLGFQCDPPPPAAANPADPDDEDDDEPTPEKGFNLGLLKDAAATFCWIWAALPVGDPVRATLPRAHQLLRARLAYPFAQIEKSSYLDEEEATAVLAIFGGEEIRTVDSKGEVVRRDWTRGALTLTRGGWRTILRVRPATLGEADHALLTALAGQLDFGSALNAIDFIRGPRSAALLARLAQSPVPEGQYEANPAQSAPETVQAVAAHHGVSAQAASLYLQSLTLLAPTRKDVLTWNDWKAKTYDAAAAQLVAKGLLLEAKRARTGRDHFLPCPWVESRHALCYERWKQPLYGIVDDVAPLRAFVPVEPLHLLFERAWARCLAGDTPRYDEVRR
jgi:hypothetical protein